MKNRWWLISSVFQLVIGLLAVAAFCVLFLSGAETLSGKWIVTLALSVAYVVMGGIGIASHFSAKKEEK